MAEVSIASYLEADPDQVWARATSPEGINDELKPLMRMTIPDGMEDGLDPATIALGRPIGRSWILLFGLLPFEYDDITIVRLEPRGFLERSKLLTQRSWEHERKVEPEGEGCVISDRVAWQPRLGLPAGALKPVFNGIFNHRHRRLRERFGGRAAQPGS
jgi:hypothetical protein